MELFERLFSGFRARTVLEVLKETAPEVKEEKRVRIDTTKTRVYED